MPATVAVLAATLTIAIVSGFGSGDDVAAPGPGDGEGTESGQRQTVTTGSDGVSVTRLAGAERFATAASIAVHHASNPDRVYLATGADFADALAAGAVAGGHQAAVLLTTHATLPRPTGEALEQLSPDEVVVVGGETAISSAVAEKAATAANASLRRVGGSDRLATASRLAKEAAAGSGSPVVYLATGEGFADALAGGAAAAADGVPLLLTVGERLPPVVLQTVTAIEPAEIKVLGGVNAIPDSVVDELRVRSGAKVERLAGADRFGTAVAISQDRFDGTHAVYLATGRDFPDALAATAAAGAAGAPLLLSEADALPAVVADELDRLRPSELVALGGRNVLTQDVVTRAAEASDGRHESDDAPPDQGQDEGNADGDGSEGGDGSGKDRQNDRDRTTDADHVFSGHMVQNGFTVPEGEVWAFDPDADTTVTTTGNVVVRGTLEMKPASADVTHTLEFDGVDETQFQGGHTDSPLASDVGLWVVDDGQLDLQGTPRAGWNRTGDDPSWRDGDEIRRAPIERGVTATFPEFAAGDPVPSVTAPDGSEHPTEVFNLTRNVRIHGGGSNPPDEILSDDGRAHVICLQCNQPQTIKHVEFRWLGPRTTHDRDGTDGLLGRYPLHFHHGGDGTRGSEVVGTVVRDSGNQAYVPHMAHGVTFRDTISFDTLENAYTWDSGDETHDVLFDHAAAFLTQDYPSHRGYSLKGFKLGQGQDMTVRDSVVAGHQGNKANSGGFHWPSSANQTDNNIWTFENNVAHNNKSNGIATWQNDYNVHPVDGFVAYHNGNGISHGAYLNRYIYSNGLLFANDTDLQQHALSGSSDDELIFSGLDLGTIKITKHAKSSSAPNIYRNVRVRDRVIVDEAANNGDAGGIFEFRYDCDHQDIILSEDDFDLVTPLSRILIVNECSGDQSVVHGSGR